MPRMLFENLSGKETILGAEPWAEAETVAAGHKIELDYDEPAELVVSLMDDGSVTVSIDSDRIVVTSNGRAKKIGW